MATIQDIKQRAQQVKDATQIGENTANRVGGVLVDMADHLEQDENQLSSLYPADATPTAGSDKPVKSGGVHELLSQLLPMDEVPTPNSVKPVKSGGVFREVAEQIMAQFGGRFGVKNLVDVATATIVTSAYFDNIVDGRTTIVAKSSSIYRVVYRNEILKKGTVIHFTGTTTSARAQYYGVTQIEPSGNIVGMELDHCYLKTVNGQHDDWFIMPYDGYFFYAFYNQDWSNRLFDVVVPELYEGNVFSTGEKVNEIGIDALPAANSSNLVQSGGVAIKFDEIIGRDANYVAGKLVNSAGGLSNNSQYGYSVFINCAEGDSVAWSSGGNISYAGAFFCFYDTNKAFLKYYTCNALPRVVVAPANAAFIRGSIYLQSKEESFCKVNGRLVFVPNDAIPSMLLKEDDAISLFSENVLKNKLIKRAIDDVGGRLDNYIEGKMISSVGNVIPRSDWGIGFNTSSSDMYFACNGGDVIGWHYGTAYSGAHLCFYDEAKNRIGYYSANAAISRNVTAPSNARFFAFSYNLSYTSDAYVAIGKNVVWRRLDGVNGNFNLNGVCNTDITVKVDEFSDLFLNAGVELQSFLFFTDPHLYNDNYLRFNEYLIFIQKYYRNTPTDFVLNGGDWLQSGDTDVEAVRKLAKTDAVCRRMFDPYYPVLGNHDTNYQGTLELQQGVIDSLWFRKYGRAYYDFVNSNTRWYIFDTGKDNDHSFGAYRMEQAKWFAQSLIDNGDTHIALSFHIYYYNTTNVATFARKIIDTAAAYNSRGAIEYDGVLYDFSSATGKVHVAIVGHSHRDFVVYDSGIPIVGTINTQRGDTPSFDLMLIDYDNDVLNAVRVGSGESRIIPLTSPE